MKLFRIRGGVDVAHRKELSSEEPIMPLPLPSRLYVPLRQHGGAPAEPVVSVGDRVLKGQLLAAPQGSVSAPVHAPTSGEILNIGRQITAHPSAIPQPTIVLESDGCEEWVDLPPPIRDPFAASAASLATRVADCGIVGLGGAAFPTAVKLDAAARGTVDTLVINGAECEPYLTCDDRIMRERAGEIIDGVRIMAHALGATRIVIAIERNKPQALDTMTRAADTVGPEILIVAIPARYPMGSERHLVLLVTGREIPARRLPADVGVSVHNVATARAVHRAVRVGEPLISRVMTVSGGAVRRPRNLEVPIGALVCELLDAAGGTTEAPARLLAGGPMMGQPLHSLVVPVVKGTSGILALAASEIRTAPEQGCIRCGTCVSVCPCGLVPMEMAALIRHEKLEQAVAVGLHDCVACGSCAYACPSHIPLVQYFHYAKGRLKQLGHEQRRRDLARRLAASRAERLERIARAKREAVAARKAAAAAKKVAEAQAHGDGPVGSAAGS